MGITGEYKVKRQKNGNEHYYIYYHCTRKNKLVKCKEPCIRQESLDQQISSLLQKFSLREDWANELLKMLKNDKAETAQSSVAFVQENKNEIEEIQIKLQRLLDGYLEQDIDREVYREEKAKLLSEKRSLEEQSMKSLGRTSSWPTARRACARRAERVCRGNLLGWHCVPPPKWTANLQKV